MDRAKCFFDTYNSFTKIYGPSFDQIGRRPSRRWAWLKNWVLGYNSSPFFSHFTTITYVEAFKTTLSGKVVQSSENPKKST